jgi:hypothetical protein
MGTLSKKTRSLLARIAEMHANGVSQRAIAAKEGVSPRAVRMWLLEIGATQPKAKATEKKPTRALRDKRIVAAKDIMAQTARMMASSSDRDGLEHIELRLKQIRELIPLAYVGVMSGEFNPAALNQLSKLELSYETDLAKLRMFTKPIDKPDPEKDPDTLEASDRLATKIARMVTMAEEKRRCIHCNKHPDR